MLLDWSYIHFKGMTVYSNLSAMPGGGVQAFFGGAIQAMSEEKKKGNLHLDQMITHHPRLTVEDINALFKEIDEKDTVVKAVISL